MSHAAEGGAHGIHGTDVAREPYLPDAAETKLPGLDNLLNGLKAAAEPTRLRLLAICSHGELTVSELTQILGQSQPRVSRHLRLLCEAGLLDRFREGSWVFYRIARDGAAARLASVLVKLIPEDDPALALDFARLRQVKDERARIAEEYFRANAAHWNQIRSLHVPEAEVERALSGLVEQARPRTLLDIGTGTGHMLELFSDRIDYGLGIDRSHDMLAVARANLERADLRHCHVRLADFNQLPIANASFDAVIMHQVLHYADDPARALSEAARVLAPGGHLFVIDFAAHELEYLRGEHAHRRLGFSDEEVVDWLREVGLRPARPIALVGDPLTVVIWSAAKANATGDEEPQADGRERPIGAEA